MILNGYDTYVGSKITISDNIPSTLKMLSTTDRLKDVSPTGVKTVDAENGNGIKTFIFPITTTDFRNNKITVLDNRHYINKNGKSVNPGEYEMIITAALLQQLAAKGSRTVLNGTKPFVLKAFARSITGPLARRGNLTRSQSIDLQIILGHYYNCLLTDKSSDWRFVSQNAINQALRYSPGMSAPIIDEVGYIDSFKDLYTTIKEYPTLSGLSKLDLGGFIGLINQIWPVYSGFREIVGASIEMPHLFTAMCYVSVTNNNYKKSALGREVDPKENGGAENFVKTINSVWPN